jgi:hypothetical protein
VILLPLHRYHPPLRISRASAARWFYLPAPAQGDKGAPGGGGQEGNFQAPSRQAAAGDLASVLHLCPPRQKPMGPRARGALCSAGLGWAAATASAGPVARGGDWAEQDTATGASRRAGDGERAPARGAGVRVGERHRHGCGGSAGIEAAGCLVSDWRLVGVPG